MAIRPVTVSAPGKVILHGEHAVVYGQKALAAAVGLRTTVNLEPRQDELITLTLANFETTWSWNTVELAIILQKLTGGTLDPLHASTSQDIQWFNELPEHCKTAGLDNKFIAVAVEVFIFLVGSIMKDSEKLPSFSVEVTSSIPVGAGLGSSASYCVSLSAAILVAKGEILLPSVEAAFPKVPSADFQETKCYRTEEMVHLTAENLKLICKLSFEGERLIHGRPSGIDNSISTYGGILAFKSGSIEHLTRIPQFRILLINTKVSRSTKNMVSGLRDRYQEFPAVYSHLFESIGAIAEESCVLLDRVYQSQDVKSKGQDADQNYSDLEKLIDMNQKLLVALGVSHSSLDQVNLITNKHDLHSKLTGAGGGGCAFALIRPDTSEKTVSDVTCELTSLGFEVWETTLGDVGVKLQVHG